MDIYVCPRCGKKYLECDLRQTHCSENFVGVEIIGYCPSCFNPTLTKPNQNEANEFFDSNYKTAVLDELKWE